MKKKKIFDTGILILIVIAVIIAATSVFLAFQLRTDTITDNVKNGEPINVAFLIRDDTTLLFTELFLYHPFTGKAAIYDIPGEWGAVIESINKMDRIDVLYKPNNPGDYINKIEQLLDISIAYYIELSLDEVERFVDLIEGIEMFIANPVELSDEASLVLIPSGSVLLDGRKTRTYISYIDSEETDIEYRGRHQKFVQSLIKRMGERATYIQHEDVFEMLKASIHTNLSKRALLSFVKELPKLNADHIVPKPVHGDEKEVDNQTLLFPYFEGELIREGVRQMLGSIANAELIGEDELITVLEILNGTDRSGLASRTKQLFVNYGYDVLRYDNAEKDDYEHTVVISRTGHISDAHKIAVLIKCDNVLEEPLTSDQNIDVTIILGNDFDGRYCK